MIWLTAPTIAFCLVGARFTGWFQPLELAAFDWFVQSRPTLPADDRIVIVGLTETDIRRYGWPLKDEQMAQLLEQIRQQKPLAIGLDFYRDLAIEPGHDRLNQVFRTTPNLIGITKVLGSGEGQVLPPPVLAELGQIATNDAIEDRDGKLRRAFIYPLTPSASSLGDDRPILPSLAVTMAVMYLQQAYQILPESHPQSGNLILGRAELVPLEKYDGGYTQIDTGGYQILFNPSGPARSFTTVSVSDVLLGKAPRDLFQNRLVLVGATAVSLNDFFLTAYTHDLQRSRIPGVEIHAALTSQIIRAALGERPLWRFWSEPWEVLWIIAWTIGGTLLGWGSRSPYQAIAWAGLGAFGLLLGSYLGVIAGWWIPVMPPLVGWLAGVIGLSLCRADRERHDRQLVMNLFGRHVTPQIAEAIWQEREHILSLGRVPGRQLTATVLFSDLKNFSTISEQTDPERLMMWLNEYMEAMAQVVLEHHGIVDKFIGDAVMAVFGVPIPSKTPEEVAENACRAVACALAMAQRLQTLNEHWLSQGQPTTTMRIGISTGPAVTGSLGSSQRLDYTTIGDSVNVAARLESYNKVEDYSICRILVSEETYYHVKDRNRAEFIGTVLLKGREQPVNVYRIVGAGHS